MPTDKLVALKQSDLDRIKDLATSLGFYDQLKSLGIICRDLPYILEGKLVGSDGRVVSTITEFPYKDLYDSFGIEG
jgi:hypothetical protein